MYVLLNSPKPKSGYANKRATVFLFFKRLHTRCNDKSKVFYFNMVSFKTRFPNKMCVVNHIMIETRPKGIALFASPDLVMFFFARIDFMTLHA